MLALLLALCASADDLAFEAVRTVEAGMPPSFTVTARTGGALDLSVACGRVRAEVHRSLAAGETAVATLDGVGPGDHACSAQVRFDKPDGSWAQTEVPFQVRVVPPLILTVTRQDIDLDGRGLTVRADRPVSQVSVTVLGAYGEAVGHGSVGVAGEREVALQWSQAPGTEAIRIDVRAVDTDGFEAELVLLPWSYAIPHDDVTFETGSHEIRAGEAHKLEDVLTEIAAVRDKYGAVAEIRLYVAGYTDTVGARSANQELSERRARAIAEWFAGRGVRPVWYQGFGEDVQAVATPDEADEPANRRAQYVVSGEAPGRSPEMPREAWVRVP